MYKVVWIARFRPGLSRADGRRYWRDVHGPLGRRVGGIERYVQSHATDLLGPLGVVADGRPAFDGYSSCWFADRDAFHEALGTPEWAAVGADGPNVFEPDSMLGMSAALDEQLIIDGAPGPYKAVWIVRFKDDIRGDADRTREAHEYWTRRHGGSFGREVPGIDRYLQNHVVEPIGEDPDRTSLRFDGFSECWFADSAAFERAMASPEWAAMNQDAESFCDVSFILDGMSSLVEEHVIVG